MEGEREGEKWGRGIGVETEGGGGEGRGDSREGATEDGQEEQTRGEDRLDNKEPREPRLASSPSPPRACFVISDSEVSDGHGAWGEGGRGKGADGRRWRKPEGLGR